MKSTINFPRPAENRAFIVDLPKYFARQVLKLGISHGIYAGHDLIIRANALKEGFLAYLQSLPKLGQLRRQRRRGCQRDEFAP